MLFQGLINEINLCAVRDPFEIYIHRYACISPRVLPRFHTIAVAIPILRSSRERSLLQSHDATGVRDWVLQVGIANRPDRMLQAAMSTGW
jgi:hypothetical protein